MNGSAAAESDGTGLDWIELNWNIGLSMELDWIGVDLVETKRSRDPIFLFKVKVSRCKNANQKWRSRKM